MRASPRHRRSAPPRVPRETRLTADPRPGEIVLAGAHGGAGTSTLAVLLAPAWDLGVIGVPGRGSGLRPHGRPVVLVASNTVAAAGQAITATTAVTAVGACVAVLVVVGDGLPEPAEARYRFRVLEGRVGAVVRMPFVPAFRAVSDPAQVRLPRRARRALAEIRALAFEQAPSPAPSSRPQGRL